MIIKFDSKKRLKKHQHEIFHDGSRFKVAACGRRFGKSYLATYIILTRALQIQGNYFFVSPTFQQSRQIIWDILKDKTRNGLSKKVNESRLEIELINGSKIYLKGADRPDTMRGVSLSGCVLDEFGTMRNPENVWNEVLRPALSDQEGWAIFISSPKGRNFFYDLYKSAQLNNDWNAWQLTTLDGGYVKQSEIDAARNDLDAKTFTQEYEAGFNNATGRVYDDYSEENYTNKVYDDTRPIIWTHDFNYTPLSSAIIQNYGEIDYVIDEIILESAVARNAAMEFVDRFKDSKIKQVDLYGDAAGRAGEKHAQDSDWTIIKEVLEEHNWRVTDYVLKSNGAIKDGQNSLRGRIMNANGLRRFFINPKKCKYSDKGMESVSLKEGSTFQEVDSDYQHITTALRYYTGVKYPFVRDAHFKGGFKR